MKTYSVSCEVGGKTLKLETGKLAKQADGSVVATYGDTVVLATVCAAKEAKPGQGFFPLTVEFAERYYASGKIPGSFLKREGRPNTGATLSARMIDRPIRPLFPEGYLCEVQVVATILSLDKEADVDIAAAAGVSAALTISDVPFNGPTAACRVGRINGELMANPSWDSIHTGETELEVIVAGTKNGITMVEGGARQIPEEDILQAILFGHREITKICGIIEDLKKQCGKPKREFTPAQLDSTIKAKVTELGKRGLEEALRTKEKLARYEKIDQTKQAVLGALVTEEMKSSDPETASKIEKDAKEAFELLKYNLMREMILSDKVRIDGRDTKTIRPIAVEAGLLPRTHGSSLFTRGETQVLAAVTLGTGDDEGIIDNLYESGYQKFFLHYNFPPFSVGETGRMGGQSRREIGHGALAERAVTAILPKYEDFPYTLRVVCETLESNGSSSMGSVCSASMALMDAGVPTVAPVAGIAMGLIKEGDRTAVLSDILGDEDHLGDMDFKVAGTEKGVTGIQMDIKIDNVNEEIMRTALQQAHEGRLHILNEMKNAIEQPRTDISPLAPKITTITVPKDKIREVIGSGGKVIKDIIARTGCKINIDDDGIVNIASSNSEQTQMAIDIIQGLIAEPEDGKIYSGKVKKIVEFGAFIGILPNYDGLLHVSEIAHERVNDVNDYLKEGEEIEVKVIGIDPKTGKVKLSRRVLLPEPEGGVPPRGGNRDGGNRPPRGDRGRRPQGKGGQRAHH